MTIEIAARGRLGRDPERRETSKGETMATASIACEVERYDRNDPDKRREPLWLDLLAFGKQAEKLLETSKGALVAVTGRLEREHYEGRDGRQTKWKCIVDGIVSPRFPAPRQDNGGQQSRRQADGSSVPASALDDGSDLI